MWPIYFIISSVTEKVHQFLAMVCSIFFLLRNTVSLQLMSRLLKFKLSPCLSVLSLIIFKNKLDIFIIISLASWFDTDISTPRIPVWQIRLMYLAKFSGNKGWRLEFSHNFHISRQQEQSWVRGLLFKERWTQEGQDVGAW